MRHGVESGWEFGVGGVVVDGSESGRGGGHAGCGFVGARVVLGDFQVGVGEGGVGETEAELVGGFDARGVEVAVVDEDAFFEVELGWVRGEGVHYVGAPVSTSLAPGEGCLCLWVDFAIEHVGDCVAGFLTRETGPENCGDIWVVLEGFHDDRANRVQDNNGVGVDRCNMGDQGITVLPQCEVVSVSFVAINGQVTFTRVGIGENKSDISASDSFCNSIEIVVIADIDIVGFVFGSLSLQGCVRCDQIGEVCSSTAPTHGKCTNITTAVAAGVGSAWIIMRIFSNHGYALGLVKWQSLVDILQ